MRTVFLYLNILAILTSQPLVYVNALLAQLNARGSHLERKGSGRHAPATATLVFHIPGVSTGTNTAQAHSCDAEEVESYIEVRRSLP